MAFFFGEPGNFNETFNGTADQDFMFGDGGNDTLFGNGGNDLLNGDSGNDSLQGGFGQDTLSGGEGNDTLNGLGSTLDSTKTIDTLIGGSGDDLYLIDNLFGIDVVVEGRNAGIDTVRFSASGFTDTFYTLTANVENLELLGNALGGTGNELNNRITGNNLGSSLDGEAGNDTLIGGTGGDFLDGGTGVDIIEGGAGNDSYVVDDTNDIVVEAANAGIDFVLSSANFTLSQNVENLQLFDPGSTLLNINGTGNTLANDIQGSNGNNALRGLEGNDTIDGIGGNDTIDGGTGNDILQGGFGGNDSLLGGIGNDLLQGDDGGLGNDTLDGGSGSDTMEGGLGNDLYVVDSTGDVVTESLSFGGTDTVRSSITFTLGDNLENLELSGTAAINGTGNTLNNLMTGNSAANTIDGGSGNDTLIGGAGDDLLIGGIGFFNDRLRGQAGNDILNGGSGNDSFVFAATAGVFTAGDFGVDQIEAFSKGFDKVVLSKSTFSLLSNIGNGLSNASDFAVVTNEDLADNSAARIVFSADTNSLFFNSNGITDGFGTGAKFATIGTPVDLILASTDFVIEA